MSEKEKLLSEIEAFCLKYGFGESQFGSAAMGYCSFISQARLNSKMLEKTVNRARSWMAKYEADLSEHQRQAIDNGPVGGFITGPEMARIIPLADIAASKEFCWSWNGYVDNQGYGKIRRRNKLTQAHRVFYEFFMGDIPDGLVIDHLCRNRSCVNPHHMEPVTAAENTRRGIFPNSLKLYCPNGHPYFGQNLIVNKKTGGRACRTCRNLHLERHYDKKNPNRKKRGPNKKSRPTSEPTQKRKVIWPEPPPEKRKTIVFVDGDGRRIEAKPLLESSDCSQR